ncbi:MAG: hypothetical protein AAF639_39520 [Chloroflexota bacterium]
MSPILIGILAVLVLSVLIILFRRRNANSQPSEEYVAVSSLGSDVESTTFVDEQQGKRQLNLRLSKAQQKLVKYTPNKAVKQSKLSDQFHQWVTENERMSESVCAWIGGFSQRETKLFIAVLNDYCQSLAMELQWLFDSRLEKVPDVHHSLTDAVTFYCEMLYHTAQLSPQTQLFQAYTNIDTNLAAKSNRELVNTLYHIFSIKGLIPVEAANEVAENSNRKRRWLMVETVQQAFEESPVAAMNAFYIMLTGQVQQQSHGDDIV